MGGLAFSDEGGGFRLLAASGSGSQEDPFVVVEEITGPAPAILVVRGLPGLSGRTSSQVQPAGFSLRKVVINRTGYAWSRFELELRERLDEPSDYYDGLSFDQPETRNHPFRADRFAVTEEIQEPFDLVRFSDGAVRAGEVVTLDVVITDTSPGPIFFLIQLPQTPVAGRPAAAGPTPASWTGP